MAWDWTDNGSGKEHFKIYRTPCVYNPYNWVCIDSTSDTTYTDTEIIIKDSSDADDKYLYHVRLVDLLYRISAQSVYISTWGEMMQKRSMVGKELKEEIILPQEYNLYQNYPNPFNSSTEIKFQIPEDSHVVLSVYDIMGREVKVLINENMNAGYYKVRCTVNGLASGVYIYRIKTDNYVQVKRMLFLK